MRSIFGSDALLWSSVRPNEVSAWHGHVAFAHWIIEASRPNLVVELGTHNGVSYFSFCNSIKKLGINSRAVAIDSWEGDSQAGFYDNSVYDSVVDFNNSHFTDFSTLKRGLFDDFVDEFENESIDLLHIDGLHTYEAVRHDYETWMPKLSDRAIILFHDTNVRKNDFGVWKFWEEIRQKRPGFNFLHAAGLGVLIHGVNAPAAVKILAEADGSEQEANVIREKFDLFSRFAKITGSELDALHLPVSGKNIALHCRAYQSSFYETNAETPQGAVNGIRTGRFGFHTAHEDRPWWCLDLGSVQKFDEIRIYNRLDAFCPERSRHIEIFISDDRIDWKKIYSHDGTVFGGVVGKPLLFVKPGATARFILLRLRDTNFFHLDEVEVYQHEPPGD
ncbi:class I SAM-dependent methyltransferase [Methylobacterium oryzae]|uniref:F5/8 type C domain-containing protein n=1 Tax=Methylobacterium oryzae TaxID=334852 RepID=A0ABU7TT47_9HYPH